MESESRKSFVKKIGTRKPDPDWLDKWPIKTLSKFICILTLACGHGAFATDERVHAKDMDQDTFLYRYSPGDVKPEHQSFVILARYIASQYTEGANNNGILHLIMRRLEMNSVQAGEVLEYFRTVPDELKRQQNADTLALGCDGQGPQTRLELGQHFNTLGDLRESREKQAQALAKQTFEESDFSKIMDWANEISIGFASYRINHMEKLPTLTDGLTRHQNSCVEARSAT